MSIREERDHVVGTRASEQSLRSAHDSSSIKDAKDLLRNVPVGDYTTHKHLHFAASTDSVFDVVSLFQREGFQSVPVLDVHKQKHFAFVDLLDVLVHTLRVYDEWKEKGMTDEETQSRFRELDCGSLAGVSGQSPFQTVSCSTPTQIAIEKFVKFRVRRLPIVDDDGKVVMVLSQFGVLEYLHSNSHLFVSCTKTVAHYKLGYKAVHSVRETDQVIDAFRVMLRENVSGVALLNLQGEVVGGLSTTDIKRVFVDDHVDLSILDKYIVEFKRDSFKDDKKVSKTLVSISPDATVGEALAKFIDTHVHRLFVMNPPENGEGGEENGPPSSEGTVLGIISAIDLLHLLNHEH